MKAPEAGELTGTFLTGILIGLAITVLLAIL